MARRCPTCGGPSPENRKDQKHCSRRCFRRAARERGKVVPVDPTPEQLVELTPAIRAGWTEEQALANLRPDWRLTAWIVPGVRATR